MNSENSEYRQQLLDTNLTLTYQSLLLKMQLRRQDMIQERELRKMEKLLESLNKLNNLSI